MIFPPSDHIDADQRHTVDAAALETVHNTIDTDGGNPRRLGEYMMGPAIAGFGSFQVGHDFPVPARLTTYIGAPVGDISWTRAVFPTLPAESDPNPYFLGLAADRDVYTGPGEQWRTWGHGPLTAQVGQFPDPTWCRACAAGGTVDLGLTPLTDDNPDSTPQLMGPANVHTTVYRDGAEVFSQDYAFGAELTDQPQKPGVYRLVFDLDASSFPLTQSTATHTDVTVPYAPSRDGKPNSKATLPAGNSCMAQGTGTTPCTVLPVLNLGYHLATDATNTSHSRIQTLDLAVGHQSYGGVGSTARATGATVSVSYDKGATWTAAAVVPTIGNHFLAVWPNAAAAGSTPWLKVTATDALGGSITQTVANAYTIG
ncbi:hypothetical protein ACFQ9X_13540 [Catenulispora yoronensis]